MGAPDDFDMFSPLRLGLQLIKAATPWSDRAASIDNTPPQSFPVAGLCGRVATTSRSMVLQADHHYYICRISGKVHHYDYCAEGVARDGIERVDITTFTDF